MPSVVGDAKKLKEEKAEWDWEWGNVSKWRTTNSEMPNKYTNISETVKMETMFIPYIFVYVCNVHGLNEAVLTVVVADMDHTNSWEIK